jgi:DNA invertase Pin-like site-specific DNA recombinase
VILVKKVVNYGVYLYPKSINMKQAAMYLRVSTSVQDYERQRSELQALANSHGYDNVDVYAEKISGLKSKKERPELSRLLSNAHKYECIYISEISRLGRNPSDTRQIIDDLSSKKIPVYIQSLGQSTLTAGKRNSIVNIILQVLMEFAASEIEQTVARSKSGRKQAAKEGKVASGHMCYGYKNQDKYLAIEETEAEVIRKIFGLYIDGKGVKAISKELHRLQVPTKYQLKYDADEIKVGKKVSDIKWSDMMVLKIIENPIYKGKRHYSSDIYQVPAIVSAEIWDKANEIRQTKTHRNYLTTYTYLLKDLCTCGICNRNVFAKYKPVQGGDKAYVCSSLLLHQRCTSKGINITLLESAIYNEIINSQEILKYLSNDSDVISKLQHELNELTITKSELETELKTKQKEEEKLVDLYLANSLSKDIYTAKYTTIQQDKDNVQNRLKTTSKRIDEIQKSLLHNKKTSTTKQMLLDAKNDRVKLQGIYKQIIHDVMVYASDDYAVATITFQINGIKVDGKARLFLDKKGIRNIKKQYRYKAYFVSAIEDDDDVLEVFDTFEWCTIPSNNLLFVTNEKYG